MSRSTAARSCSASRKWRSPCRRFSRTKRCSCELRDEFSAGLCCCAVAVCVLRVSLGAHLSWAANQSASPTNATNQLTHAGAGRYTSWGDAWFLFSILYILSKVSLHASATFATEYLDVRADQPTFSLLQSILKSLFTAEEWPSTLAEFFGADVILTLSLIHI